MKTTINHIDPENILQLYHMRKSKHRLAILSILAENERPVSLPAFARKIKGINRATLFKVLHTLEAAGVIYKVPVSRGIAHFAIDPTGPNEGKPRVHLHFSCGQCKKVYSLSTETVQPPAVSTGFTAGRFVYCLYGTCAKCGKMVGVEGH